MHDIIEYNFKQASIFNKEIKHVSVVQVKKKCVWNTQTVVFMLFIKKLTTEQNLMFIATCFAD